MNLSCTTLRESTRSVRRLKIDGCPPYPSEAWNNNYIASRWEVEGYDWEIRFYPSLGYYDMALQPILLSEPRADQVTATLSGRLVDPSGAFHPSTERIAALHSFKRPSDSSATLLIITASDVNSIRYYLKNNSVTVECTITVLNGAEGILPPFSNLQKDLGEFLQSEAGADVTFVVSGESFSAHKNVLAARSPVFMAEFFGAMKEKRSTRVEVKEMEAAVFKAMLHFIYTATVPELDEKQGSVVAMAQHLFVAADRYGLDSLKVLCKRRLTLGIATDTVATTLALAEQHGCSQLKAQCVEFITGGSQTNLDAVIASEGFKRLESSSPSMLTELLKAAHKRIRR